jgi:ribonuclease T2
MQFVSILLLLALSLAGCSPADVREVEAAVADSATLIAVIDEVQAESDLRPIQAPQKPTPTPVSARRVKNTPGDFDFYVLALSWSPDYCASNSNDAQQCSVGKKLGFVLHGLWPQYKRGYPADCSNVKLSKDAQAKFPNLYPSPKLYTHEWNKHGTCSGLKPLDYLALSKSLKEAIAIPAAYRQPTTAFRTTIDDLKASFAAANSTLGEDALAVQCSGSGRFLKELYVCFSREGKPIACSTELQLDEAKSCGRADFLVRNVK